MNGSQRPRTYAFGDYALDTRTQTLRSRSDGHETVLHARAFDTLVFLLDHAGELVSRETLMQAVWPKLVVESNNLDQHLSTLRQLLGEKRGSNRYIATIRGRGYRFVATVTAVEAHHEGSTPDARPSAPAAAVPPTAERVQPPHSRALLLGAGAAAAAVLAAVIALGGLGGDRPTQVAAKRPITLAVLPFRPLTASDRNESLELGMAETLIAGLNAEEQLRVRPLSSVRRYVGPEHDALAAGAELQVAAVLEGHIQRDGEQLRVSAQLLAVADGRQLWADRYDVRFTEIFPVQDAIAARVRDALLPELTGERGDGLPRYTSDPEAYQLYANGRFYLRPSEAGMRRAIGYFEQAIRRDPAFALAYVGLAEGYSLLGVFGIERPRDVFPQARAAVDKAIELAPDLGEAYASLGHINMQFDHDWAGAQHALERAIELNPSFAPAQQWYGHYLAYRGRLDEGLAQIRKAQALEPASPSYGALIGMFLSYQRRYDDAIAQLKQTLEMDPSLDTAHAYLAMAYLRQGHYEQALHHLARTSSVTPGSSAYLGQIYALSGRRGEAVAEVERLLSSERYVPAHDIAAIYAALGDIDRAFEFLERAIDDRSQMLGWVRFNPVFDSLRADPRYTAFVRRLGLG